MNRTSNPTPARTDGPDPRASIVALEASIRRRTEGAARAEETLAEARSRADHLTARELARADREATRIETGMAAEAAAEADRIRAQAQRDEAALRRAARERRDEDIRTLLDATVPPLNPRTGSGRR
ncbi:MAG: hypothetical protein JNL54_16120 [Kineosporiaceae bacterium]|nr:hypothetical protein [Kineosporiaceae bacterium]